MRKAAFIALILILTACGGRKTAPKAAGTLPESFSFQADATVDEDLQTGRFRLHLHSRVPAEVYYELQDRNGTVLTDGACRVQDKASTVTDRIPSVRLWNAEDPQLYTLLLEVDGQRALFPVTFCRIMPYKRDTVWVNGRKVPLKRVSLQESRREALRQELQALRQANANTIALGKETPSRSLRYLCDSLGLYISLPQDTLPGENPQSFAVRHSFQEIGIEAEDLEEGLLIIHNRRQFTPLKDYSFQWRIERDGQRIKNGKWQLETPPGASETVRIGLPALKEPGEYRLLVEAVSQEAGTATADFLLGTIDPEKEYEPRGTLALTEGDTRLVIKGGRTEMVFDRGEGSVKSLQVNGETILTDLQPVFDQPCKTQCTWSVQEQAVVLQMNYLLPGAVFQTLFTLSGDGVLKAEGEMPTWRFRMQEGGIRYFGRGPDLSPAAPFKSARKADENETGLYTDTSWLQAGRVTVIGEGPFAFSHRTPEVTVRPGKRIVLVPGTKPSEALRYRY